MDLLVQAGTVKPAEAVTVEQCLFQYFPSPISRQD